MRLGLYLGYWGVAMGSERLVNTMQDAERLGYDSVWTAEAYGSDAATVLAFVAARTTTIKLGSAIFQMPARSPAMTAMTAATIDQLSGGRMLLGLGSSGPQARRAGTASGSPGSFSAPASTSKWCGGRWGVSGWSITARRSSSRCPADRESR